MPRGRLTNAEYLENLAVVARIRKLLKEGQRTVEISKVVNKPPEFVNDIKNRGYYKNLSFPVNGLGLRIPSNPNSLCRRCGEPARIVARSLVCVICELREMAKQGLVTISGPEELED